MFVKIQTMEDQLEEKTAENQKILREKRTAEKKLQEVLQQQPQRDRGQRAIIILILKSWW